MNVKQLSKSSIIRGLTSLQNLNISLRSQFGIYNIIMESTTLDTLSGSQQGHAGRRTPGACCNLDNRSAEDGENTLLGICLDAARCRLQSLVEGVLDMIDGADLLVEVPSADNCVNKNTHCLSPVAKGKEGRVSDLLTPCLVIPICSIVVEIIQDTLDNNIPRRLRHRLQIL